MFSFGFPGQTFPGQVGLPGQYPGSGQVGIPGQYPGGGQVTAVDRTQGVGEDGSDSQAMSEVKQSSAGTQASASAEGKHAQGSAKSQVSGIYTGTGSFSAQAGTSDTNKSAQTQVISSTLSTWR